jgi:hypothetical protein
MKKKSIAASVNGTVTEEKGLFRQAGELIGSIGAHIADGKDKILDFVSEEVTLVKKTIKKKLAKKQPVKKVIKKAAKKLSLKKTARKPVSKKAPAKKASSKKVTKKLIPKKVVRKITGKIKRKK